MVKMLKKLMKLIEPRTLVAGFIPVLYGSLYSFYAYGQMNFSHMVILLIGILLAQSSANMINDLYDYRRGADQAIKSDEKVLVTQEVTSQEVKKIVFLFLMIDVLIGGYFMTQVHMNIGYVIGFGGLILFFYSAGPRPISYTCWGEVMAGTTMGIGILSTVIYIHSGVISGQSLAIALPTTLFIASILLTNNLSDHREDAKVGRRTLPIVIGEERASRLLLFMVFSLPVLSGLFYLLGWLPLGSFILSLLLFPFRKAVSFKEIPKRVAHKGQLMALVSTIGLRYHVGVLLGLSLVTYSVF